MKELIYYKKRKNDYISCVFTDSEKSSRNLVIMAHGFRSSSVGSSRKFVLISRCLADKGIASLRFDQIGSGNSSGDFFDSSFDGWIETIQIFIKEYINEGYNVAMMGDSMGATAVVNSLKSAEIRKNISGLVLWVPDPKIDKYEIRGKYAEEGGQRVNKKYWSETYKYRFIDNFKKYKNDCLIIYGENDKHISENARKKVIDVAKQFLRQVIILKGEDHSNWSYLQSKKAINNTVDFFVKIFNK